MNTNQPTSESIFALLLHNAARIVPLIFLMLPRFENIYHLVANSRGQFRKTAFYFIFADHIARFTKECVYWQGSCHFQGELTGNKKEETQCACNRLD